MDRQLVEKAINGTMTMSNEMSAMNGDECEGNEERPHGVGLWNRFQRLPYTINLFKEYYYQPSDPFEINVSERITWKITPYFGLKNNYNGVHLSMAVHGLKKNEQLNSRFALQQPGNERQCFDFTFDGVRNTFNYKFALILPRVISKKGIISCKYLHNRFLRSTQTGEQAAFVEGEGPEVTVPMHWEWVGGLPMPFLKQSINFEENIKKMEDNRNTFMYWLFLERARLEPLAPRLNKEVLVWPKPTKTAHYLGGRRLSVDKYWFEPVWSNFSKVMDNVDLLSERDYNDLIDLLGYDYHGWAFAPERVAELVRVADKLGFYFFGHQMGNNGHFEGYVNSLGASFLVAPDHPLKRIERQSKSHPFLTRTCTAKYTVAGNENDIGAPYARVLSGPDGLEWTVSFKRITLMGIEYLSIVFVIGGFIQCGKQKLYQVMIKPVKSPQKLHTLTHTRVVNDVHRTIAFPTAYLWWEVVEQFGKGPFKYEISINETTLPGWRIEEVATQMAATGELTGGIRGRDGVFVRANRQYLEYHCTNLKWDPLEDGTFKTDMLNFNRYEILHFLDYLYHGSKYMDGTMWKELMKIATFAGCDFVISGLERALIRIEPPQMLVERVPSVFRYHKFHAQMKEVLGIESVNEYLLTAPRSSSATY